jgi:hypothetical protein
MSHTLARPTNPVLVDSVAGPQIVVGGTPFAVLESTFRKLVAGPAPLSLPAPGIDPRHGDRPMPVHRLRGMLLRRTTSPQVRDAVWCDLVGRARTDQSRWLVVVSAMALPRLRQIARRLRRDGVEVFDLQAELLAGFVAAVRGIDLDADAERVCARLCNGAQNSARTNLRLRTRPAAGRTDRDAGSGSDETRLPAPAVGGHPDEVLDRAVAAGVLTADEADLIAATYLDGTPVAAYAAATGRGYEASVKCRQRAAERLRNAIEAGDLAQPYSHADADLTLTRLRHRP